MNKSELIDALAERLESSRKDAAEALDAVLDTITRQVAKGEKVAITGFGAFEKAVRPARTVRNPQTGKTMKAKKKSVPKFKAGAELKAVISGEKKLPKIAKKATAKKATAKKAAAKKAAPAKKTAAAKKGTAKKTATKKAAAKKAPAKKTAKKAAKKAPVKKAAKKAPAKKAAKKAPAKKTAKKAAKKAPAKKAAKKA